MIYLHLMKKIRMYYVYLKFNYKFRINIIEL